jgi:ribosomal protein S18 acetylase RimI-like enzyme
MKGSGLVNPGPISVRDAAPDDAPSLLEIWTENRTELAAPRESDVRSAVARIAADPSERLLLGVAEGEVVGLVHMRRAPITPIHGEEAVHISHLHVRERHRRRGLGRALVDAAAAWAQEKESEHLLATANASARDANRFLARLGLTQVAVVRAATVSAIRMKVAGDHVARSADQIVAARRSLRRRRRGNGTATV